jgi:hypothetical protein
MRVVGKRKSWPQPIRIYVGAPISMWCKSRRRALHRLNNWSPSSASNFRTNACKVVGSSLANRLISIVPSSRASTSKCGGNSIGGSYSFLNSCPITSFSNVEDRSSPFSVRLATVGYVISATPAHSSHSIFRCK